MNVLVAMSGGVDSSVAAALLQREGHDVVGVTLKLWGGPSDQGCCSVSDVEDARRVADHLGIEHHVFNFSEDFEAAVVAPYVTAHARGQTPNPCISCNRYLKFDRLVGRARALGFDAVATGHHARIVSADSASPRPPALRLARGADAAKDQSYVLYMLDQPTLGYVMFPVGSRRKAEVRALARDLGLRTADKPDSQEVCFISAQGAAGSGRQRFLAERMQLTPGRVIDTDGRQVGQVASVQLVTIGQRKGLGLEGGSEPQFVLDVDVAAATVTVGSRAELARDQVALTDLRWAGEPDEGPVLAQASAHGEARPARLEGSVLHWEDPYRRVAPGQVIVFYRVHPTLGEVVLGGGTAT